MSTRDVDGSEPSARDVSTEMGKTLSFTGKDLHRNILVVAAIKQAVP